VFGVAILVGQLLSGMTAAFTGSMAPVLFSRLGMDPTSAAGPMETAIQDVVGGTILLAFSAWILQHFGDYGVGCPGHNLQGCIDGCALAGAATAGGMSDRYNATCLHYCVKLDGLGVC
jgi:hypothetical protein